MTDIVNEVDKIYFSGLIKQIEEIKVKDPNLTFVNQVIDFILSRTKTGTLKTETGYLDGNEQIVFCGEIRTKPTNTSITWKLLKVSEECIVVKLYLTHPDGKITHISTISAGKHCSSDKHPSCTGVFHFQFSSLHLNCGLGKVITHLLYDIACLTSNPETVKEKIIEDMDL